MLKEIKIKKHHIFELEVQGVSLVDNPYFAELTGEFTGPSGQIISVPGFVYETNIWKIRFSPNEFGDWTYKVLTKDIQTVELFGKIYCIENNEENIHGGLKVNPHYKNHFIHEDGTPHFMMAYECNWLWALETNHPGEGKVKEFIDTIKGYGFNQILMNVYAHDTSWRKGKTSEYDYGPPDLYCWGNDNDDPDHSKMNDEYFKRYDDVIHCLWEEGIIAHLYFMVLNKLVNMPKRASKEENMYFKYVVARYQAYSNIIWDISKEAFHIMDKDYIVDKANLIKKFDGHNRLLTLHDDAKLYKNKEQSQVLDFYTTQQHYDHFAYTLFERMRKDCPIFIAEFGYESGPEDTYTFKHSSEELIKRAYLITMAGGYTTYYYSMTAWDVIDCRYTPPGYKYFQIFKEFFAGLEWYKLEPKPDLCCWHGRCLAEEGKRYVLYIEENQHAQFNLPLVGKDYNAYYLNMLTGEKIKLNKCNFEIESTCGVDQFTSIPNPFKDTPAIVCIEL